METIGHFIGGKRVAGTSGRTAKVFNPATGEVIGTVAMSDASDVDAAVKAARKALENHAGTMLDAAWEKEQGRDRSNDF